MPEQIIDEFAIRTRRFDGHRAAGIETKEIEAAERRRILVSYVAISAELRPFCENAKPLIEQLTLPQ
jgi:hypothetical protein